MRSTNWVMFPSRQFVHRNFVESKLGHIYYWRDRRARRVALRRSSWLARAGPNMTHSQLCRESLSKHFVEVPLRISYFDKDFRQRISTKILRHGFWDRLYVRDFVRGNLCRSSVVLERFL